MKNSAQVMAVLSAHIAAHDLGVEEVSKGVHTPVKGL